MTKSELEVLRALAGIEPLPHTGGDMWKRYDRHEKVIEVLKSADIIYKDNEDILQFNCRCPEIHKS